MSGASVRDPWRTEFSVQPFKFGGKRQLTSEPIRSVGGPDQAIRLAERLAPGKAGVVAFSRRVAPALDEYEAPKLLAKHGSIPSELLDQLDG